MFVARYFVYEKDSVLYIYVLPLCVFCHITLCEFKAFMFCRYSYSTCSVVKKQVFLFFFLILIRNHFFPVFSFCICFFFRFFICFYQSYDCVVSPYFVYRVHFSTHNNTHNDEIVAIFKIKSLLMKQII